MDVMELAQELDRWDGRHPDGTPSHDALASMARHLLAMQAVVTAVDALAEWERRNGTHFALIEAEEVHVMGLWADVRVALDKLKEGS